MTTQELISKLRELDKETSSSSGSLVPQFLDRENYSLYAYVSDNLPRIIRLLEAGGQLAEVARNLEAWGKAKPDYEYPRDYARAVIAFGEFSKGFRAALSAYEEAGK